MDHFRIADMVCFVLLLLQARLVQSKLLTLTSYTGNLVVPDGRTCVAMHVMYN